MQEIAAMLTWEIIAKGAAMCAIVVTTRIAWAKADAYIRREIEDNTSWRRGS